MGTDSVLSPAAFSQGYLIGIDLGARSIGWAAFAAGVEGDGGIEPTALLDAGVRIFEAGVEGNIEEGKDESKATARRTARGMRRQLFRRAQRIRRTLRALCEAGLLPNAVASPPDARHTFIHALDARLFARLIGEGEPQTVVHTSGIYQMRRRCLSRKRELDEIGRALFHLAQRRGFKSNRKDTSKDDEKGKVKSSIAALKKELETSHVETLGQYLAGLDPHQQRIRNRWASRAMYEEEFAKIWAAQAPHHPAVMTDEAREKIRHAIFHQRPLKSQSQLIGFCSLETQKRRAPLGCLIHQRFRLVQTVNSLTWADEHGVLCGPLSVDDDRRAKLIERLDTEGDLTLSEVKAILGLPKRKGKLSLEEGPAKILPGNRTAKAVSQILGSIWHRWENPEREQFVNELISGMDQQVWEARLRDYWNLPPEIADKAADLGLQEGYASLSRRAMRKLLPHMEAAIPYATAVKTVYGALKKPVAANDLLPGVLTPATKRYLGAIRNPAVVRALTELRKVINALIRRYGSKPLRIRIELARDLRKTRQQRFEETQRISKRTDERADFVKEMKKALPNIFGGRDPLRADIEKWALAEECNWECPYTCKPISPDLLFGPNAQFDIEHIIPRSIRPDDSFANKTLCHADENRAKGNQTPYQAYHGTSRWDEILSRVRRFQGPAAREKLRRFEMQEIDSDFVNRDLNDTRYGARLAKDYIGLLFGGSDGVDDTGTRRVQVCCGGITAVLRNEWGLNKILSDSWEKNREDHRHHAVDAVVIGLAGPSAVKLLSTAAATAQEFGRKRYAPLGEPWHDFRESIKKSIDRIVVSHRADYSLSGALHQGTNFSPTKSHTDSKGKPVELRHVRKKLIGITAGQIESIADERIKKAVVDFLAGRDPKQVFKDGNPFPTLPNRRDPARPVPIRRVRIKETANVVSVGGRKGVARHVAPGENHLLVVIATKDKRGNEVWDIDRVISRFEAAAIVADKQAGRLPANTPLVQLQPDERLVMTLQRGDYLRLLINGQFRLMRVTSIGKSWIQMETPEFASAKMTKDQRNAWLFQSGKKLLSANVTPVYVSILGEVRGSHERKGD
jgi:CRISPR-associated endonuclease Csn1